MTDRPSAFTDSPEDLIARARHTVDEGHVTPGLALLLSDLARELTRSRASHANRMSLTQTAYAEKQVVEVERDALRKERDDLRRDLGLARTEVTRARRGANFWMWTTALVLAAVGAFQCLVRFR